MKIYLAHNFSARDWLKEVIVPKLEKKGHQITSRWVLDIKHTSGSPSECAQIDLDDITDADTILLFIDEIGRRHGLGKYIEFGYAIGIGKSLILIGKKYRDSIFYNLPDVKHYENIEEFTNQSVSW